MSHDRTPPEIQGKKGRMVRFPIRLKMLVVLLLLVTVVVAAITWTMANLFHRDKSTYIHDLTSIMALHVADETRSVIEGYRERLRAYMVILENPELTEAQKVGMIDEIIRDFGEFVAISVHDREGKIVSTIYDSESLEEVGLTKEAFAASREAHHVPADSVRAGRLYVRDFPVEPKLPAMVMAVAASREGSADTVMVSAVLRTSRLARLVRNTGPFAAVVLDSEGTVLAPRARTGAGPEAEAGAGSGAGSSSRPGAVSVEWLREAARQGTEYGAGVTREFLAGATPMVGGLVPAGVAGVVAGVQIPQSAAFLASRELLRSLGVVSLLLLLGATGVSIFLARRMTRPVERLSLATRKVGQGLFDVQVEVGGADEIGALAQSFNTMAYELQARDHALAETQEQLIRSEKMAAFGQLGAGIAHEVKNPLAGILGCAQLSLRMIEKGTPTEENLQLIVKETRRCKEIIENLLKFSRQDKAIMTLTELGPVIDDAIAIVRHQCELNKVKVEKEVAPDLPRVMANANQLQQVLMNLMMNAQQAMEGRPGNIRVGARGMGRNGVEIRVVDDGPGIPEENRKKIFEPFFTTKPSGKGTGLGLSVSYKIIKDHGGEIGVEGAVGQGTTFLIDLPVPAAAAGRGEPTGAEPMRKIG